MDAGSSSQRTHSPRFDAYLTRHVRAFLPDATDENIERLVAFIKENIYSGKRGIDDINEEWLSIMVGDEATQLIKKFVEEVAQGSIAEATGYQENARDVSRYYERPEVDHLLMKLNEMQIASAERMERNTNRMISELQCGLQRQLDVFREENDKKLLMMQNAVDAQFHRCNSCFEKMEERLSDQETQNDEKFQVIQNLLAILLSDLETAKPEKKQGKCTIL
ncbi:uncharacterized protein LOC144106676 [Amblyomma americanum]